MITYRFANASDMADLTDLINMVFSMVRVPHDFGAMLPKVYSEAFSKPEIHVVAEENGKLVGALGLLTFPLTICGRTLNIGYLGSMAVHPRVRSQGVMKEIFVRQVQSGIDQGLDMMVLGGQRQRYQYYGFETCGGVYTYSISGSNVRHALRDLDVQDLAFEPMGEAHVSFAKTLYDAQAVTGARTADNFLACVKSYREKPYVIMRGGEALGYFVTTEDGETVTEILAKDDALILPAIKAYMQGRGMKRLTVEAAPHDVRLNSLLAPICEGFHIGANTMVRVLKPERVIPAYLALKHTFEPLSDGSMTVGLGDLGAYEIVVQGGLCTTVKTDKQPELFMGNLDMHQLLFGYNPFALPAQARGKAPAGWFPLPYHIPTPDSF